LVLQAQDFVQKPERDTRGAAGVEYTGGGMEPQTVGKMRRNMSCVERTLNTLLSLAMPKLNVASPATAEAPEDTHMSRMNRIEKFVGRCAEGSE
jgi:hypothetical protein